MRVEIFDCISPYLPYLPDLPDLSHTTDSTIEPTNNNQEPTTSCGRCSHATAHRRAPDSNQVSESGVAVVQLDGDKKSMSVNVNKLYATLVTTRSYPHHRVTTSVQVEAIPHPTPRVHGAASPISRR